MQTQASYAIFNDGDSFISAVPTVRSLLYKTRFIASCCATAIEEALLDGVIRANTRLAIDSPKRISGRNDKRLVRTKRGLLEGSAAKFIEQLNLGCNTFSS